MAKRAKSEEIITKLTEAEVRLCQDESVGKAAKSIAAREAIVMVDPLTSRVSSRATNLIDAGALLALTREASSHAIAHPDQHGRYGRDGAVSRWSELG